MTAAATVTTAGDLFYADAATSMGSRLAIGAANKPLVSSGKAPTWADVPDHASRHSDSGADPLIDAGITDVMVSGEFSGCAVQKCAESQFAHGGRCKRVIFIPVPGERLIFVLTKLSCENLALRLEDMNSVKNKISFTI